MHEFLRRLHYLLNRRRLERELAQDMEVHREMAERDGHRFGNSLRLREEARDAWGWTWIDRLLQDLRCAVRALRGSPAFSVAAVLMLGIGIGATVAAFGFFNLVVLKALPVRDPDSILRLHRRAPRQFASDLPYPVAMFYREHATTLSAVWALHAARVTVEGEETQPWAQFVTTNFLSELGATARLGRILGPRDDAPEASPVAVLSHGFWQRHCGADPQVVGTVLRMNGKTVTVVGVAAREFSGLSKDSPAFWLPLLQQPHLVQGSPLLTAYSASDAGVDAWGRLRPGFTPQMAEEELRSLAADLRARHPNDMWEGESVATEPGGYAQNVGGRYRGEEPPQGLRRTLAPVLALLGTLVLLILTVACGNLGSLLLVRGVAREREIAVRIAVGATTGRLVRQLFTESLVLALLGSATGLIFGYVVLRGLMVWTGAPAWLDATPDGRVVVFAVGMGFVTAVLFGLAPARQVARQRHRATLTRQLLIGAQVASSCVLLIVAGLLIRALGQAVSVDPGFEYEHVVSIEPDLASHGYSAAKARAYLEDLRGRLVTLPGVESVSLSRTPPLGRAKAIAKTQVDGSGVFDVYLHRVDPEFFRTMKIPLLRGRRLTAADTQAVVVSASLARRAWPHEDPLGKLFPLGVDPAGAPIQLTVVGVSGDARTLALKDPDAVELYQPADLADLPAMTVLARTSESPVALMASVAAITRALDPDVVPQMQSLKTMFRHQLQEVERSALAVSVLGAIALSIACLGVVGLVAYTVSQRTREIAIQLALGAKTGHILTSVLGQFHRTVAVGLLVGVGAGAAVSQLLRRELYGISHLDPVSYLAAVALFAIAAAVAALGPALRALRVNPMHALRCP